MKERLIGSEEFYRMEICRVNQRERMGDPLHGAAAFLENKEGETVVPERRKILTGEDRYNLDDMNTTPEQYNQGHQISQNRLGMTCMIEHN